MPGDVRNPGGICGKAKRKGESNLPPPASYKFYQSQFVQLNATPAGAIYGGDSLLRASVAARSLPGSQTSSHSPLASVPPCPIPAPPPTHDPTARDDFEDPVNWALDRHGNLRDSSHMDWINDPHDEDVALPPAPDEEPLPLPALSETSRSPAANPAPPELPPTWEE